MGYSKITKLVSGLNIFQLSSIVLNVKVVLCESLKMLLLGIENCNISLCSNNIENTKSQVIVSSSCCTPPVCEMIHHGLWLVHLLLVEYEPSSCDLVRRKQMRSPTVHIWILAAIGLLWIHVDFVDLSRQIEALNLQRLGLPRTVKKKE